LTRPKNEPPTEELVRLLPRVMNALHTMVGPTRAKPSLTFHQFHALLLISQDESASPKRIGIAMGVAPSTASELVDRLVRSGLVIRRRLRDDRRRVHLRLSPEGHQALSRRVEELSTAMRRTLSKLPSSDVDQLLGAFKTVLSVGGGTAGRRSQ
jgi:DNA-binding MarR family transcriptional regulator